jgi:hypothetical protein
MARCQRTTQSRGWKRGAAAACPVHPCLHYNEDPISAPHDDRTPSHMMTKRSKHLVFACVTIGTSRHRALRRHPPSTTIKRVNISTFHRPIRTNRQRYPKNMTKQTNHFKFLFNPRARSCPEDSLALRRCPHQSLARDEKKASMNFLQRRRDLLTKCLRKFSRKDRRQS